MGVIFFVILVAANYSLYGVIICVMFFIVNFFKLILQFFLFLKQNLSQLASINYDLLTKGWKEDPSTNPDT